MSGAAKAAMSTELEGRRIHWGQVVSPGDCLRSREALREEINTVTITGLP